MVEHVYKVWHDVVEQALVVRDEDYRALRAPELIDPVGYNAEGVDVEPAIGLVEYGELRL